MRAKPRLASPDLMHITRTGGQLLGDVFADLLLDRYDRWRAENPEIGWFPEECGLTDEFLDTGAPEPGYSE